MWYQGAMKPSLTPLMGFVVVLFLALFSVSAQAQSASDFTTSSDGNGGLIITGYTGAGGAVSIPSTITNETVTGIGASAFFGSRTLTSITIPNTVTSIGEDAFAACEGLSGVTIPSSVTSIGDGAFVLCNGLSGFSVDPANANYSSVNGVLFDKNQRTLIQYPVAKAYSNPSYVVPPNVTSIGDSAFQNCGQLTKVTIANSVTSIGPNAFYVCSKLTSVTIPDSVTSIGDDAFQFCSGLTTAVFLGNAPTMGSSVFGSDASGFTVYYSAGAAGFVSPLWTDSSSDAYAAEINPIAGTSMGNDLYRSPWFGHYTATAFPLIYQYDLGYEYVFPAATGVYLYDYTSGHFWYTQSSYFPIIYDFSLAAFIYLEGTDSSRNFYNYSTSQTFQE